MAPNDNGIVRLLEKPSLSFRSGAILCSASVMVLCLVAAGVLEGQNHAHDTGPRGAPIGAGRAIAHLTDDQVRFFNDGKTRFAAVEGVANGLGPTFNADSCGVCHSQPAVGGTSPSMEAFPHIGPNPQVAVATAHNAHNKLPFFVTPEGPVREARFKFVLNANGTVNRSEPDNNVHDLFTIERRDDLPNPNHCELDQEDFERAQDENNLSLRIPTPVFGGGLIESIDDATILANINAQAALKSALGIHGRPNRSGNDGTITRFGWKAQVKSLLMFSHEAYNVELGETNQMFPQKRGFFPHPPPAACVFNPVPEDATNFLPPTSDPVGVPSDDDAFSTFMRFLDQPTASCTGANCSASINNGKRLFTEVVMCALCHTPSMTTGRSVFGPGLSGVQAELYSDLLLHRIGSRLDDGISQGNARGDEFRTAPLWGVGQRIFFLHDGRTRDLLEAIEQHASPGSEANSVIARFNALTEQQKQDILNFLRSL